MRIIEVITVGRSDYGIYLPILQMVQKDSDLRLNLTVSGMHLSPEFGLTVEDIEKDGFNIHSRVEMLLSSDTPEGISKSIGLGIIGFSQTFAQSRPDILLLLGDRFEMYAAAVAALPYKIPVAHIHGGEITEGAIDNALRYSITKLSHLHFVAVEEYARRVRQVGEEPWRVTVSGAPALDQLGTLKYLSKEELAQRFGLPMEPAPLLVTFHPVTLEFEQTRTQVQELLKALETIDRPIIFTAPNADTQGRSIMQMLSAFVEQRSSAKMVMNLGTQAYFSLMAVAAAMVGNSSSGIIEAPSFELPVVNIGTRQKGRIRAGNVIDVGYSHEEIIAGIRKAISTEFCAQLKILSNPYGNGHAAEIIVRRLKEIEINERLLIKCFVDIPQAEYVPRSI